MNEQTKSEKIKQINKIIGQWVFDDDWNIAYQTTIWDILKYVYNKWWNMVVACNWKILFNKQWTNEEEWSYREVIYKNIDKEIWGESDELIDFIYSLIN
jgi:hypothetical protein